MSQNGVAIWSAAAIGTLTFSVLVFTTEFGSLWATSSRVQVPAVASQSSLNSGFQQRLAVPVGNAEPVTAADANIIQEPVAEPLRSSTGLRGALLGLLSVCAAAWAWGRVAQRPSAMAALDLEEGRPITMASAAGESNTDYHFIVANAKFMLFDEEHAMELLREKRRYLREKGLPQNFWIVPNPEFLDNLPDIDKRVAKPCAALVSTDEGWIRFMKLRYDRVLSGSFKGSSDVKKALATKGGDPIAAVPKWQVPADWNKAVPYPHYADDWFHPFLVGAKST